MKLSMKKILMTSLAALMVAGVGATTNNVNARRYHRGRRIHRVYRYRSAWHRGIPSAIRGHYTSYSYVHGHIRHGERNLINLNRSSVAIGPKLGSDPFGLSNVRTKKIGYGRYSVTGHVISVGYQGRGSLTITKRGHRAYISCSAKIGGRRMNGSYYTSRYSHAFRVLNSEV